MNRELAAAWELHRAGRFADAARLYSTLLEQHPDDADARHLFGILHLEHGYLARAVELISQAIERQPDCAAFHANLAEAYRGLGEAERAVDCCQAAIRLQPIYPEAANNLGLALDDLGRSAEAVAQFRKALAMRPEFALAHNNLGTSLRQLGRMQEALDAFRTAARLDPELARARSNLGQMLVDDLLLDSMLVEGDEADEALVHCQEAVRLDPTLAAGHNNLGNVYRALERWDEAFAAYEAALRLAPDLPLVHANRGLALFRQGNRPEAFASFRRAAELAPNDADILHYVANAHASNDNHEGALEYRERIVALEPDRATPHAELGWTLHSLRRLDEADASYRRALELQPDHLDALTNLGSQHEELGSMAEAEDCYRRAHAAHPWAPGPLSHLATLLRGRLPDADRQAIEDHLARLRPKAPARGPLLFGLAQVLDAKQEYARAAECLVEANRLALEQNRKRGRTYDQAFHVALVDRIIAGFTPELFARLGGAPSGDGHDFAESADRQGPVPISQSPRSKMGLSPSAADTRQPVFVFGLPRSGTTLVEQVLASHSRVFGAGELSIARRVFESVPEVLGREDDMKACLDVLDAPALGELRRRHLELLQAECEGHEADRIVDKMPDNYLYVGLLALMFPRATFIHVLRDVRDIALSCWRTNFGSIRWANDPEHVADRVHQHRRLLAHWRQVLPVPVHEVVYERLVDDFEPEVRRLLAACGLEWEPACLEFHQTSRPVHTASVTQVRQPLYRRAVAHWKHYEPYLADLFDRLPAGDLPSGIPVTAPAGTP